MSRCGGALCSEPVIAAAAAEWHKRSASCRLTAAVTVMSLHTTSRAVCGDVM